MVMDKHGESSITRKNFQTQIAVWYCNVIASTIILYPTSQNSHYYILNDK